MRKRNWRVCGPYKHELKRGLSWRIHVISPKGRRKVFSFSSQREAIAAYNDYCVKIRGDITITEAIERSVIRFENNDTRRCARSALRQFFKPKLTSTLSAITHQWCLNRYGDRVKSVAVATQHYEHIQATNLFIWCIEHGLANANPMAEIKRVGTPNKGKKQFRRSEFERFTLYCLRRNTASASALYLLAMTGLRTSELLSRQVRDFDECADGSFLYIPKSKTPSGVREIELPPVLADKIRPLTIGRRSEDYLFCNRSRNWLRLAMIRTCKAADVPYISPGALRGTHASIARKAGATAAILVRDLGHTTYQTTKDNYLNPGTEESARILDLTGRLAWAKS